VREVRLGQTTVARIEQVDAELVQPSIISYKPLQIID
jgi:hypothetical protein